MLNAKNPAVKYCRAVLAGKINAPHYVKLQCQVWDYIVRGKNHAYCINEAKVQQIDNLLSLFIVPKGLLAGHTCKEVFSGFQWLFIVAVLCTVERANHNKRKYESAILEICRKNGKTFIIAVLFIFSNFAP